MDDWKFIRPRASWWGFIKAIRVYGYVDGFVNIDVKCTDDSGCDDEVWEIHEKVDVFYQGYFDVGPNAISAGIGVVATPAAGAVAAIITAGGSALTGGLGLLKKAQAKAEWQIRTILANGPDALCLGTPRK
jgi:hypothetical protein